MTNPTDNPRDDLPPELTYLLKPALQLVGNDRQIVGCGQVDFGHLERVLRDSTHGLTPRESSNQRKRHFDMLNRWLGKHRGCNDRLVVGMQFVALLLESDNNGPSDPFLDEE